ncbi:unnamed protein product, partial [Porites lobata]
MGCKLYYILIKSAVCHWANRLTLLGDSTLGRNDHVSIGVIWFYTAFPYNIQTTHCFHVTSVLIGESCCVVL